ncbi:MAG: Undecaprenyl-phosphate 4-deoxy-4-formamido-L-arabinose transferase [Gammaproteobacteria bacterium]|nr:Undecaprenyl-phosphate 4-deoxy-4-formamido-L-arabinose transferase [Gammaproteobacteria bacterium]
MSTVSLVLPARNEAPSLQVLVPRLRELYPSAELIVVNDGSTDDTAEVAVAGGAIVVSHPYPKGNGAAIKTGARVACGEVIVCMDADGQHAPEDVNRLLARLEAGFEMVVGARDSESQASLGRWLANTFYNRFASWVVKHKVHDLTSGFRVVRARQFREFMHLYPNGFSYPTTSTMAFFRSGYSVAYVPIKAARREGRSHIRPIRDGLRFLLIMIRICTLFSPLRIFLPCSFAFLSAGLCYYLYTYINDGRFTNMSALLISTSIVVFLIGLVSEQITALTYQGTGRD